MTLQSIAISDYMRTSTAIMVTPMWKKVFFCKQLYWFLVTVEYPNELEVTQNICLKIRGYTKTYITLQYTVAINIHDNGKTWFYLWRLYLSNNNNLFLLFCNSTANTSFIMPTICYISREEFIFVDYWFYHPLGFYITRSLPKPFPGVWLLIKVSLCILCFYSPL